MPQYVLSFADSVTLAVGLCRGAEFENAKVVAGIIVGLVIGAVLLARALAGQVGVKK